MKRFKNWIKNLFTIKMYSRKGSVVPREHMNALSWPGSEETSKNLSDVTVVEQTKEDFQKEVVAKFVESIDLYCGTLADRSLNEIRAFAVGFYGIDLTRFYGPKAMDDIDQYSDEFLGKIQKFQALRTFINLENED